MRRRFKSLYGATPLHLIALVACFALTALAVVKVAGSDSRWDILLWFLGSVALHDLVLFPLYTGLDRLALGRRLPRARAVNFVRVPVLLSGFALLVSAGLVFQLGADTYASATGLQPTPYLERWLALTAALFLASGLLYAVTARRAPSQAGGEVSQPVSQASRSAGGSGRDAT